MCGIFAYAGSKNNASDIVLDGLKLLEYRGYDSWGVAFVPKKGEPAFVVEKRVGKIGSATLQDHTASQIAIGHTRWATHGGITVANAHPHFDSEKQIAVVHNGIIENYQALKKKLIAKGYVFTSQTDTEIVAHLIADFMKKCEFVEAVHKTFPLLSGLNAFVVLNKKTQEVVAVRNGSPLAVGKAEDGYYVASDATAMSKHVNKVYYLDDFEMVVCTSKNIRLVDVKTQKEKRLVWQELDFNSQDLSKGSYEHFMLKEIMEQPRVLFTVVDELSARIQAYAQNLDKELAFVGCGTAYHAALAGTYFFSLIAKKKSAAVIGSEFAYSAWLKERKAFITFLSQSGETIDIVEQANMLKKLGIPYGAIVNRLGSTLERSTNTKILLSAGPEQCVLATKSYTAKIAVLFLLAHALARTDQQGKLEVKKVVEKLPAILAPSFVTRHIVPLAKRLVKHKNIFIIGRGMSYPLSLEAALKIKEVTYIHTEGFAGGDLKHGVIALIEKDVPCIVFAPHDETFESTISNAMEIKSRGGCVIGISDKPNEAFDIFIPVENVGLLSILPHIVVIQLLAYHMALSLGNDPDKPRNLAKSVTVR